MGYNRKGKSKEGRAACDLLVQGLPIIYYISLYSVSVSNLIVALTYPIII